MESIIIISNYFYRIHNRFFFILGISIAAGDLCCSSKSIVPDLLILDRSTGLPERVIFLCLCYRYLDCVPVTILVFPYT